MTIQTRFSVAFLIPLAVGAFLVMPAAVRAQTVETPTGTQAGGDAPYQVTDVEHLSWHVDPEFPQLESAVLYGVVSNAAPYTYRLRATRDGHVTLHSHERTEFITVLAGTLYHATGNEDRSSARRCTAGCFIVIPAGGSHQGWLTAGTMLQVHGLGPIDAQHLGLPGS